MSNLVKTVNIEENGTRKVIHSLHSYYDEEDSRHGKRHVSYESRMAASLGYDSTTLNSNQKIQKVKRYKVCLPLKNASLHGTEKSNGIQT